VAVKSILEVDVDDTSFQAFYSSFQRYQEAIKRLPGAWAASNAGAHTAAETFADISAAMMAQNEMLARAGRQSEKFAQTTSGVGNVMRNLQRSTKDVAGHIEQATRSLLKWTGILSAVGVGGGLFGIDRLAGAASSGRRSSQGLGLSFGGQRAFCTNFGRLVNPESFLGNVAEG
jgi:hypothetical protein